MPAIRSTSTQTERIRAALALLALSACSVPPPRVGIDNARTPALSVTEISRHRIYIVTTRAASGVTGVFYADGRSPDLGLASVDVTVPPTHVVGALERPRRLPPDPRTEFAIVDPTVYATEAAFVAGIDRAFSARPAEERRILLFFHGYDTSTTDALLRRGQFVADRRGIALCQCAAAIAAMTRPARALGPGIVAGLTKARRARLLIPRPAAPRCSRKTISTPAYPRKPEEFSFQPIHVPPPGNARS